MILAERWSPDHSLEFARLDILKHTMVMVRGRDTVGCVAHA